MNRIDRDTDIITIPAGTLQAGKQYRLTARGTAFPDFAAGLSVMSPRDFAREYEGTWLDREDADRQEKGHAKPRPSCRHHADCAAVDAFVAARGGTAEHCHEDGVGPCSHLAPYLTDKNQS